MDPLFRKGLLAGLGILTLTREKIEEFFEELVKKGELTKEESAQMVKEWAGKIETSTKESRIWIQNQIEEVWARIRPGTEKQIEELSARIEQLEAQLKKLEKLMKNK